MNRLALVLILAAAVVNGSPYAFAHPGHTRGDSAARRHGDATPVALAQAESAAAPTAAPGVTGQGEYRFKLLYTSEHLPAEAVAVLVKAHGGFAVDRRDGKGAVYFALPGAGIVEISPDLKSTRMLATDPSMKDTNLHNAGIWHTKNGSFLVFPGNEVGKVFTTTLDGALVSTLDAPTADTEFDEPVVNKYFDDGGAFVPTDVARLGRFYYITTGYSNLDYVLTATVSPDGKKVSWHDLAFGGRGTGPGQFGTGHGVTISPDNKRVTVADRPNAEIDRFTRFGHYRDTVSLPAGSLACDIDYAEGACDHRLPRRPGQVQRRANLHSEGRPDRFDPDAEGRPRSRQVCSRSQCHDDESRRQTVRDRSGVEPRRFRHS